MKPFHALTRQCYPRASKSFALPCQSPSLRSFSSGWENVSLALSLLPAIRFASESQAPQISSTPLAGSPRSRDRATPTESLGALARWLQPLKRITAFAPSSPRWWRTSSTRRFANAATGPDDRSVVSRSRRERTSPPNVARQPANARCNATSGGVVDCLELDDLEAAGHRGKLEHD